MTLADRSNIVLEYVTSSLLATNPVPMTHLSHCIFEQKKARVRTIIATNTPCVLEIIIFSSRLLQRTYFTVDDRLRISDGR